MSAFCAFDLKSSMDRFIGEIKHISEALRLVI